MIDATSPETTDIADDDRLIELLGELASGPAERAMALRALSALPPRLWTLERVGGAVATIAPQAQEETDDDLAFLTWNVLSSLVARGRELSDEPVPFEEVLVDLLTAESAEIRGFAATTLGRTSQRSSARAIAEAVAVEQRWDVAIRGIGALTQASVPIPASVLLDMLGAPTQEAVAFAARALGASGTLDARPLLLGLLAGGQRLEDSTERDINHAISWLDGAEAQELATELFEDALELDDGGLVLATGGGRAAGFTLVFTPDSQTLTLDLHLPTDGCDSDVAELGSAISAMLGTTQMPSPHRLSSDGREFTLRYAPEIPSGSALRAFAEVVDHLTPAVELADRRSVGVGVVQTALGGVREAVEQLSGRQAALAGALPKARLTRTENGERWTVLDAGSAGVDSEGVPLLTWTAAMATDAVWTDQPERGIAFAISWSQETRMELDAARCAAIAQTIGWRIGLPLEGQVADSTPALLSACELPAGDIHGVWVCDEAGLEDVISRPGAGHAAARYARLLDRLESLTMFLGCYAHRVGVGEDPAESLNLRPLPAQEWIPPELPEPEEEAPETSPHQPVVEQPTLEFELPSDDAPTDDFTDLQFLRRPPTPPVFVEGQEEAVAPAPSEPDRPTRQHRRVETVPAPSPAFPSGPSLPSGPGQAGVNSGQPPLDEQGRTPAEVVKQLSADLVTVDVYLRSAGYNHAKLAQIMGILLGLDGDECQAVIDKAPCRLLSAVPRDRARTIKTVLEGTGAVIAWEEVGD